MRKRKLCLNTSIALMNQIITLICGFILPRQILLSFGSDINGLVSSISQFLGFITLMDMGVGAVVQSTLYGPLANKDHEKINSILTSANKFFNKIAIILIIYTGVLAIFYPLVIDHTIGIIPTSLLVISISISSITQYFFGITNQILLNADQKSYIQLLALSIATILNTVISIVLINSWSSINVVKYGSAVALLIRPIILLVYVKKNYPYINKSVKLESEPITQKWNGLAQHLATFVVDRTDVAVLTIMSTLSNVSVYNVYHWVVTGLYQLFIVMTSGIQSLLGDMYAKNEMIKLDKTFSFFEWLAHTAVAVLFSCTGVLMIPFVEIYTKGVTDAVYILPVFSWLMTIAYAFCCLRGYYNILIKAVGHYKQTQTSAFIEAILNLGISIALVQKMGLVGVAIGTLVSMSYRTIYFAFYLKKNILKNRKYVFLRFLFMDCMVFVLMVFISKYILFKSDNFITWAINAILVLIVSLVCTLLINLIMNRRQLLSSIDMLKNSVRNRKQGF